jgi:hypothetical protein
MLLLILALTASLHCVELCVLCMRLFAEHVLAGGVKAP